MSEMLRFGGLASGLDTHQIVDDLMKAERIPLDKMQQDRQVLDWKQNAYRDVNLQMTKLRDSFRATGLGLQSTFLQKAVSSSNTGVATATAVGNAPNTSVQLQVQQLATATSWITPTGTDDPGVNENVLDQRVKDWWGDGEGLAFVDGRATISLDVKRPGGEFETVSFHVDENDTVAQVLTKMNRSDLGVNAYLDQSAAAGAVPQMIMTMTESGSGSAIRLAAEGEDGDPSTSANGRALLEAFGFGFGTEDLPQLETGAGQEGQNSRFSLNGHGTERTTNNFTINGINYQLTGETVGNERVTITAQTDTDKIMEKIMSFVEEYNELVDTINGSLREERFRDYHPLSDEERRAMSEREVEMWEEKAMSGLLRRDPALSSALSGMRMSLYSSVQNEAAGMFKDLASIGLVSSSDYMDGGKIVLDTNSRTMPDGQRLNGEDRLRAAIESDPEGLYQLFMGSGETQAEDGVLRRLRGSLDTAIDRVTQRAGREGRTMHQFTLGREMMNMDDRISNFERRLQQVEQRYWNEFTALERAMAKANAQADQMFSLLGGGMM
ncbi:flagellar hook-associated protein 2 [Bacillus sp. H-16]|uniref:flagellar hook-associated protein 2 n=1 Tax=Alteribacter salitolerans TaxID=2912333 RepID=UPI00196388AE|nr:flagellar hook-associated protein 2 [Alteribacter salitolerans]MBM7096857.1 flagellar hook-associated protein 2 [Alteribacter salitolerans]